MPTTSKPSWRLQPDDGKPVTIEGMPIGLFENELTVQLWKPVTIRGYTFNVGDNVTLDQTKVQKTPAVGGDFAWLYRDHRQERTGTSFESFWNRLPPPLVREGNKVQTPWFARFPAGTPTRSGRPPSSGCRDSTTARPSAPLPARRKTWPTISRPGTAPSSPTRRSPSSRSGYLAERNTAHPDYLGAGWSMMANKGSPCIQCHAIGQYKPTGGEQVVNGPDLQAGRHAVPSRLPRDVDRQPQAAGALHRDAAERGTPRGTAATGAQDLREPADRDGPGNP